MATHTATENLFQRSEQTPGRSGSLPEIGSSGTTRFLGWFSIGLGVAELLAPGLIAGISGTRKRQGLIRFYGFREIAAGVGILTQRNPAPWLWFRVAGDVVDLASMIKGSREDARGANAGALAAVAGVTALDVMTAQHCSKEASRNTGPQRAEASLLINRPPSECYRFWRDVENFPTFVNEVQSVQKTGEKTSHWAAGLRGDGGQLQWDAEITEDVPNERISWRCLPGSDLFVSGSVTFEAAPGDRGTMVRVQCDYDHPASAIATPISKLIGKHPEQIAHKSLRRLKQMMELGEIITTEGQPAGRRGSTTWLDAIAR